MNLQKPIHFFTGSFLFIGEKYMLIVILIE